MITDTVPELSATSKKLHTKWRTVWSFEKKAEGIEGGCLFVNQISPYGSSLFHRARYRWTASTATGSTSEGVSHWRGSCDSSLLDLKLGYFFYHILVLKFLSSFNKEATEYKYENSDEKAQEVGGEEEERDKNEEPEGGLKMDVDLAELESIE